MKIAFIKPNMISGTPGDSMEPLVFAILSALTPARIERCLYDERIEAIPFDATADLVALTADAFTAKRAYQIADRYRQKGIPVVIGGFHPTLCPDEASQYADSIVIGDAEDTWPQIIRDAETKTLQKRYVSSYAAFGGQVPDRGIFKGKSYAPVSLVEFNRGCRFSCEFCSIRAMYQGKIRHRPLPGVLQEIDSQRRGHIFFVDDNIVADKEASKELFRALIPLKIKWVSQGTLDMVEDSTLMELMKQSGCLGHVIGFETLDPRNLIASGKPNRINAGPAYDDHIKVLKSYGLQTWAAFTLGYDCDTPESLHEILAFSLRHKFTFAAYNVLMPYPGTPFYERLKNEGRLLYDGRWWLHPGYRFNHASFVPALMTPDALTETAFCIRKKWNHPLSLAKRFLDVRTNLSSVASMAIFWSCNSVFRSETFKKQGMSFGYTK